MHEIPDRSRAETPRSTNGFGAFGKGIEGTLRGRELRVVLTLKDVRGTERVLRTGEVGEDDHSSVIGARDSDLSRLKVDEARRGH